MRVMTTEVSANRKTGPMTVTRTEPDSCPTDCPLMKVCYGKGGPSRLQWNRVEKEGQSWDAFCKRVAGFLRRLKWRHNEVGDLPQTKAGKIDKRKARKLAKAAKHTRGWTYTHHNPHQNADIIREMNDAGGLVVNLSANSPQQADEYTALGIAPVTCVLPEDAPAKGNKTPSGLPILVCPNETHGIQCVQCNWCRVKDRKFIVGFRAHGVMKRAMSKMLRALSA